MIVAKTKLETRDDHSARRVGETVVYGAHGIGAIVAGEQRVVAGVQRECVVLELDAGLRVTLSVADAALRLRSVADEDGLAVVRRTLAEPANDRDTVWTRRLKDHKTKLATGLPSDLAEVVRDGARYEASGTGTRLSAAERGLYLRARELLMYEICCVRGLDPAEAEAWIEAQLARPTESGD